MQRLRKISANTQTKNIIEQENICKLIIQELEEKFQIEFNRNLSSGSNITYFNLVTTFLFLPEYAKFRTELVKLLSEYNVDERGLLLQMLGVINQIKLGYCDEELTLRREQWLKSFSELPYHQNLFWNDEMIKMETKYGSLKVFKYDKFVKDGRIKFLMRTVPFANQCHSAVDAMKIYFPSDFITTSEIPLLFGGYMYHSYFTTSEGVVDISNNMFYPDNYFNDIFCPNEILKIRSSELISRYESFLLDDDIIEDSMAPVLALALNNKRKNISIN